MNTIKIGGIFFLLAAFTLISCHKMNDGNQITARAVVEMSFTNPVAIPMVMGATNASFAAKTNTATIGGQSLKTLSYGNGGILGPTLKINQGDMMNLIFTNQLSERCV